MALVSIMYHMI